mmetsp:Transcript_2930/g.7924  ORF Transcript_2930/g.7924 Transcript_2930/m.7924 type:complete len:304 (-) Transcript_2930:49-960(-)|eukprot:CAMPEP_0171241852 /NCGR_PEP_ID=MMETSP0790-20130122/45327_1 /TAXON_ID=2925 /ORGANISM="Alexandrium catenella, Strain OF101" /LENGTH=303 /DNA_ID=CAMNT_0011708511 /DNA_START=50 /DNA_END=961 /DNA_ORIENTATION=+
MGEVELSLEDAIRLQDELIKGYMGEDFQRKIWSEFRKAGNDDMKKMQAKAESCHLVQFEVIPKFGFEANRKGVQASLKAFTPEMNAHPVVVEKNVLMQYLIDPTQQQEIADKDLNAPRGVPPTRRRTPDPEEWPEDTGKVWVVVGGEKSGGITVRKEVGTKSPEYPEKLGHGALVEQVEREGERLKYQKMDGAGPDIGWVSLSFKGKPLIQPLYFDLDESEMAQETWNVVHDRVAKRSEPNKDAKMVGGAKKGEKVKGLVHMEGSVKWLKVTEQDPTTKGKQMTCYLMIDGSSVGLGNLLEKA